MSWLAVGVNHHRANADTIAAMAARRDEIVARLLAPGTGIVGVLPLATCNRFEFLVDASHPRRAADVAASAFAELPECAAPTGAPWTVWTDAEAVQHLFEVTAGLDSMVVGEDQVSGQVRHAVRVSGQTLTPDLRRLCEAALNTAKAVADRTGLGTVGRSLATVGLDSAGIGDWAGTQVLVLGTGSYAGVVVAELGRRGCTRIGVYSGSGRRAARFAASHPVDVVPDLAVALARTDLVVACSGHHRLIGPGALGEHRPVIVDLSGGTDVDPAVRELGLRLLTIDQLAARVPAQDRAALAKARALVQQGVSGFLADQRGREAAGTVTALRARVDELVRAELSATAGRHSPETQQAIERSLRRLAKALLHRPSARATASARAGELDDYQRALAMVFGPDLTPER